MILINDNVTLSSKIKFMKHDMQTLTQKQLNKLNILNKANVEFLTVGETISALLQQHSN